MSWNILPINYTKRNGAHWQQPTKASNNTNSILINYSYNFSKCEIFKRNKERKKTQSSRNKPHYIYNLTWAIEHNSRREPKKKNKKCQPNKLGNKKYFGRNIYMYLFLCYHLESITTCNDPSFWSFKLSVLNRSREYCLDAFLQSVPAFIIAANSS